MELFQLKISSEGKLMEQGSGGRLSLVDDEKSIVKTVREVNEISD